jgi:hypothetical protein
MAINIFKSGGIGRYYFKENNVEYGPFQLDWILQFIDAETFVKVTNSNWCPAKQHPDFVKYFNIKDVVKDEKSNFIPIEPVKNNYTNVIIGVSIVIILIVFGSFLLDNKTENNKNEEEIAIQKQRLIDSVNQINAENQRLLIAQQDSINNETSFKLDSIKSNENKLIFLQNRDMLSDKIKNYYLDIQNEEFEANNYFSEFVNQYINLTNTTPDVINGLFINKQDFLNEKVFFDDSTFIFQKELDGIYYFTYSINYSCFRPRKNKTQTCDVDVEVGFDENFKIKSYKELEIRNLTFE